jgi:hypothetical protein
MRGITGWRFLVYIAVPLVLASLGAINLCYDLLTRVESGSNFAEHQRNTAVLVETTTALEADLVRLVSENAAWNKLSSFHPTHLMLRCLKAHGAKVSAWVFRMTLWRYSMHRMVRC